MLHNVTRQFRDRFAPRVNYETDIWPIIAEVEKPLRQTGRLDVARPGSAGEVPGTHRCHARHRRSYPHALLRHYDISCHRTTAAAMSSAGSPTCRPLAVGSICMSSSCTRSSQMVSHPGASFQKSGSAPLPSAAPAGREFGTTLDRGIELFRTEAERPSHGLGTTTEKPEISGDFAFRLCDT